MRINGNNVTRALCIIATTAVAFLASGQSASVAQGPYVNTMQPGYLFIDGKYINAPYDLQVNAKNFKINAKTYSTKYLGSTAEVSDVDIARVSLRRAQQEEGDTAIERGFGPGPGQERGFGPGAGQGRRPGMGRRRGRSRDDIAMVRMQDLLEQANVGALVVLFKDSEPMVLYPNHGGEALLTALVEARHVDPPITFSTSHQASWNRLIAEFEPDLEFTTRAEAELAEAEAAEAAGYEIASANQLLSKLSYPLTIFAMIVVVFGFGHLLNHRPGIDTDEENAARPIVVKSLVIIALLSCVDLVWTIAATQAGAMRELNPLGSKLITDPAQLTLFKFVVTGTSISILYCLHRRPVAQMASWWCCLLLTLLTARWVVFQSLFV